MMKSLNLNSKMLRLSYCKSLSLLLLFSAYTLCGQFPDSNIKYIRTNILNKPFESFKDIGGVEFTLEKFREEKTFFRSFNFSLIGWGYKYYNVNFVDQQNIEQELEYAYERRMASFMYGYAYYPIKKRTVLNPYGRLYAGIGGLFQGSVGATPYWDELSYDYSETNHKLRVAFNSRLNIGLEVNLSHISPWDKDSKFSLYLASGINYMSKVNSIDFTNRQGGNKVKGVISDERDNIEYTVDVGNLHQFTPVFLTLEFGFIWRLLDY